jgi:hypothetical protein
VEVAECAADAFASIRTIQRYGREDGRALLIQKMGRLLGKSVKEAMDWEVGLVRASVNAKIAADALTRDFTAITPIQALAVADEYAWRFPRYGAKARGNGPTCRMDEAQVAAALRMVEQWEAGIDNPVPHAPAAKPPQSPPAPVSAPAPAPAPLRKSYPILGGTGAPVVTIDPPQIKRRISIVGGTDYENAGGAMPAVTPKAVPEPVFSKDNPATWTATPRNAECPCGSGKKYKYCHGLTGDDAKAG